MSFSIGKYNITLLLVLLTLFSCKDEINYKGNPKPRIKFVSISSEQVREFIDSLTVRISYEDGDGDLGSFDADTLDIAVRDDRLTNSDYYHLPPLATKGANVMIKGEFDLKLKNLFLLGSGKSETTILEIKIRDRAKNWSNTITTPSIEITKP